MALVQPKSSAGQKPGLQAQINCVRDLLRQNSLLNEILKLAPALRMPNWYVGAGSVAQTAWNVLHGFEPTFGIKDYDLVYYDSSDLSAQSEDHYVEKARQLFRDLNVAIDIKNQARIHLGYGQHFGYEIAQYKSVEHAMSTWPTTATSVGITTGTDGLFRLCAPFGLNDLLGMIVRPNKTQVTRQIYEAKISRWIGLWPKLLILSWDD